MKKDKLLKRIIEKLTDKQLLSFVKSLCDEQTSRLFWLKSWTGDELRSLFTSMGELDIEIFFENMDSIRKQILLENVMGYDEEDDDDEEE